MQNTPDRAISWNHGVGVDLTIAAITSIKSLNFAFAVCNGNNNQRDRHIKQYESALGFAIRPYRTEVSKENPNIICNFSDLIKKNVYLQRKGQAIITITGADKLQRSRQTDSEKSELEAFIEGLWWIEDNMKRTPYSVIVWLSQEAYEAAKFSVLRRWDNKDRLFRFITEKEQ